MSSKANGNSDQLNCFLINLSLLCLLATLRYFAWMLICFFGTVKEKRSRVLNATSRKDIGKSNVSKNSDSEFCNFLLKKARAMGREDV